MRWGVFAMVLLAAPAPPLAQLNARMAVSTTTARLEWEPIPGTVAYATGRTTNLGDGLTALADQATTGRDFTRLKASTSYTVFVVAVPSGQAQAVTFTTKH